MLDPFTDLYVSVDPAEIRNQFVVISGNIDDPGSFTRFAQNLLNDVVMFLRPVNAATERPDVDQIADDIEHVEFVFAQESQECAAVCGASAEMGIRDPAGSIAPWPARFGGEAEPLLSVQGGY